MLCTTHYVLHPALREYVKSIIIVNLKMGHAGKVLPVHTFLPRHTRFLCFYLHDVVRVRKEEGDFTACPPSIFVGPMLRPVQIDFGHIHDIVFVALKPTGLYRLLKVPLDGLIDTELDARAVFGPEAGEVITRLYEAGTNRAKCMVIQDFLLLQLSRLKPALPFDAAIEELVDSGGNMPVDQVAARSCLSIRQFERQSLQRLGLPPKLYARIVRFSLANKLHINNPGMTWTEISTTSGYFDQMHLIRDFKEFAGINPGSLKTTRLQPGIAIQTLID